MGAPLSCSASGMSVERLHGRSPVGLVTVVSLNVVTLPGGSSAAEGRVRTASGTLTRGPVGGVAACAGRAVAATIAVAASRQETRYGDSRTSETLPGLQRQ